MKSTDKCTPAQKKEYIIQNNIYTHTHTAHVSSFLIEIRSFLLFSFSWWVVFLFECDMDRQKHAMHIPFSGSMRMESESTTRADDRTHRTLVPPAPSWVVVVSMAATTLKMTASSPTATVVRLVATLLWVLLLLLLLTWWGHRSTSASVHGVPTEWWHGLLLWLLLHRHRAAERWGWAATGIPRSGPALEGRRGHGWSEATMGTIARTIARAMHVAWWAERRWFVAMHGAPERRWGLLWKRRRHGVRRRPERWRFVHGRRSWRGVRRSERWGFHARGRIMRPERWRFRRASLLFLFFALLLVARVKLFHGLFARPWPRPEACGMVVRSRDENVADGMPIQRPNVRFMCGFLFADRTLLSNKGCQYACDGRPWKPEQYPVSQNIREPSLPPVARRRS